MKTPEELADEHWEWIEGLLGSLPYDLLDVGVITLEYLYKTAFIHGYKHAIKGATWRWSNKKEGLRGEEL